MELKIFLLSILIILIADTGNCQDSILVNTKYDGRYYGRKFESYYINSGDSIRNGSYIRYSETGKIIRKGQFREGNPSGIWHFYTKKYPNDEYLIYDFDTFREVFFVDPNPRKLNCEILTTKGFEPKIIESPARFPGGNIGLGYYLDKNLPEEYPFGGMILLSIIIESNGKVGTIELIRRMTTNGKIEKELIKIFNEIPNWIPARYNGRKVTSKFLLPIRLK